MSGLDRAANIINEQSVNLKGGNQILTSEWKYLIRHRMFVVLIAIALIPAIYCFIYLSSMWDTYGKMDHLPVAIVNHDKAVIYHGKRINIGHDLTTSLVKSDVLSFHRVSEKVAEERLKAGKYYMILTIPEDFSKKAATIMSASPQKMNLYFRFNSGQSFVVSKMTGGVATAIKAKVSAQVTRLYTTTVLNALNSAASGMKKAAAGGQQLANGAHQLILGEAQMSTGTNSMSGGIDQLISGNSKLVTGNRAMSFGFAKLTSNTAALTGGLQQIEAGLTQLTQKSPQLTAGAAKLTQLAQDIKKQLSSGTNSLVQIQAETSALVKGLAGMTAGSAASSDGTRALLNGTQKLTTGMNVYTQGAGTLATANQHIGSGLAAVRQNLPIIQAGAGKLNSGTASLLQGTNQLLSGSQTLASSLNTGVEKLQVLHTQERNAAALANPVHEITSDIAKIPNNGTGMAPFAIAIGLYVGGIVLGTMYEAFLPRRAITWWASKASVVGSVGLLQTALLCWSLTQGTHLHVADPGAFFLILLPGSWLVLSLIFLLRLLLGGFGTWLVSIVLVIQLAASGGLYPTYLLNSFARSLNIWLPMTYLIDALRSLISTHQAIISDVWIMIALVVGFNLAMLLRFQLGLHRSFIEIKDDPQSEGC
ncbi:YhgE/Pip domain-containing protein [Sporolactobacillus sp. CQH2019]|uniref:YhgE/Pip family protein n=1 Tax=Sporolactobacillus sp. CQH2019 TaxID=3023512 RepID=UPI002368B58C|nr:YhgE/Pip domain-containing protein [Sporolactobacillus sp. CQH2019]MDD9150187.1 YhgE/Pip domain-containing protein [Sporolactobacillus sp. CQH2019]